MKTGPTPCIVRIDIEKPKRQHCWEVKIIRPGNSFHRSFSDAKFGGREGAYAVAMQCRDEELGKRPVMNSYQQAIRPKKTNRSGIVGVRKGIKIVRRGEKTWEYPVWAVTGTPVSRGKTKTKYFSILQLGNKVAKQLAIEQRKEWEESLRASVEQKSNGGLA